MWAWPKWSKKSQNLSFFTLFSVIIRYVVISCKRYYNGTKKCTIRGKRLKNINFTTSTIRQQDNSLLLQKKKSHLGARLSNSSKNSMAGAAAWARSKAPLTAASLSPMYLERSSGPRTGRKATPAARAAAPARRVLPVPGGPWRRTPRGRRPGLREKSRGYCRGAKEKNRADDDCDVRRMTYMAE